MPVENAAPNGIDVYIRMVWLFVLFVSILMLFLFYLYLALRRAAKRESQSFAFSLMVIERLETECRRIARELHDTVLPRLDDPELSALVRSICGNLMPPDFSRFSLKDSLARMCGEFSKRTKTECACLLEDNLDFAPLSAESQLHLYRMAQETFTNIEKHAGASRASLVARRYFRGKTEYILLCVSDDGKGMRGGGTSAAEDYSGAGLGLRSMRQRAVILGAKLDFINESGNGFMVRIEVPVPPALSLDQQE